MKTEVGLPTRPRAAIQTLAMIAKGRRLKLASFAVVVISVLLAIDVMPMIWIQISDSSVPRNRVPMEYLPIAMAVVLSYCLLPSVPLWEMLGGKHLSYQGLAFAVLILIVPVGAALLFPHRNDWGEPSYFFISNVLVASAAAYLLISRLGKFWGTLGFGALYGGTLVMITECPRYAIYFPLTEHATEDSFYQGIKWWWVVPLVSLMFVTAWRTRGATIRQSRYM